MIDQDVLISKSLELAPLSPTLVRLAALIAEAEVDLREIIKVISMDPALAGGVMRLANSSLYAGRVEVGTVTDAVMRLGTGTILEMAARVSLKGSMDRGIPEYGLSESMFWSHSCCASLAAECARSMFCRPLVPPEAATAALLHDIGKLSMAQFLSPAVLRVLRSAQDEGGLSEADAELAVLGVGHGELGGLIVQHWRLPESIRNAITFHHTPELGGGPMSHLINLADHAAVAVTSTQPGVDPSLPGADVLECLQMTEENFSQLCERVSAQFAGTQEAR